MESMLGVWGLHRRNERVLEDKLLAIKTLFTITSEYSETVDGMAAAAICRLNLTRANDVVCHLNSLFCHLNYWVCAGRGAGLLPLCRTHVPGAAGGDPNLVRPGVPHLRAHLLPAARHHLSQGHRMANPERYTYTRV
jgi:hypothetical protein